MTRRNIEIILGGLADAVRHRDPQHIAEFLAPDLVWEGIAPGLRCEGRQQAMELIGNRGRRQRSAVAVKQAVACNRLTVQRRAFAPDR